MNLTIREIASMAKWPEVKRAIKYHYPKDHNNYEPLFNALPTMGRSGIRMVPTQTLEIYGGVDVTKEYAAKYLEDLQKGDEEQYYGIHIKDSAVDYPWGMSFQKWRKLANIPIDPETLRHHTFVDILAHFIWEITYFGSEKQMEKQGKELQRRVRDIKSGKAKTVPFNPK